MVKNHYSKYALLCVSKEIFRVIHHAKLHPLVLHEENKTKELNRFQYYKKTLDILFIVCFLCFEHKTTPK